MWFLLVINISHIFILLCKKATEALHELAYKLQTQWRTQGELEILFCLVYPLPKEKSIFYPQCTTTAFSLLKTKVFFSPQGVNLPPVKNPGVVVSDLVIIAGRFGSRGDVSLHQPFSNMFLIITIFS